MLNLPQKSLDKIKQYLLHQQKVVEADIKELDKEDPVMLDGTAESSEPGTDSFMADAHARITAMKNSLQDVSRKIQKALARINIGTYGKCEKCGKDIEPARLEAMPTATLCLVCSKKK